MEAAKAYDAAILPLAGEFARLNFSRPGPGPLSKCRTFRYAGGIFAFPPFDRIFDNRDFDKIPTNQD